MSGYRAGVPDSNRERFAIGVVILAAGSSRRMGRPKLLLQWGSTSVLGHLLREWKALGAGQVAVVHPPELTPLERELDRLEFPKRDRILNPRPERGMFSSIQCAAEWSGWRDDLTHWVITLGDQPHLRRETLQALLDCGALDRQKICQPLRAGHRKHPVLLPAAIFSEMKHSPAADLKQFLHEHASQWAGFESDDPGLELDIDTPGEYERAQRLWSSTKNEQHQP